MLGSHVIVQSRLASVTIVTHWTSELLYHLVSIVGVSILEVLNYMNACNNNYLATPVGMISHCRNTVYSMIALLE